MQEWLRYFLDGVAHQANDAVARAEDLTDLQQHYRAELSGDRSNAIHVVDLLFANPVVTTARVSRELGLTRAGALNLIRKLEEKGWLRKTRVAGRGGRITWISMDIFDVLTGALDEPWNTCAAVTSTPTCSRSTCVRRHDQAPRLKETRVLTQVRWLRGATEVGLLD